MKKAFSTKKEVKQFFNDYKEFNIPTEKLSNIITANSKNSDILSHHTYLTKHDNNSHLRAFIKSISDDVLSHSFGKHDFSIKNKDPKKVHVLEFNGLHFLVSNDIEVAIPKKHVTDFFKNIIEFEKAFINTCLKYAMKNRENLSIYSNMYLLDLEASGFINADCSFNFNKTAKNKTLTASM